MELTKENLKTIIVSAVVVILAALYLLLYSSVIRDIRASYSELKKYEEGLLRAREGIAALERLKIKKIFITEEEISACIAEINALETTRALYLREVGESQEATKKKDKALAELEDWMSDFHLVAKIAMEDQPQLLESLGVLVRS